MISLWPVFAVMIFRCFSYDFDMGQNCDLDVGQKCDFCFFSLQLCRVLFVFFDHVLNTYQNCIRITSQSPQNRIKTISTL